MYHYKIITQKLKLFYSLIMNHQKEKATRVPGCLMARIWDFHGDGTVSICGRGANDTKKKWKDTPCSQIGRINTV